MFNNLGIKIYIAYSPFGPHDDGPALFYTPNDRFENHYTSLHMENGQFTKDSYLKSDSGGENEIECVAPSDKNIRDVLASENFQRWLIKRVWRSNAYDFLNAAEAALGQGELPRILPVSHAAHISKKEICSHVPQSEQGHVITFIRRAQEAGMT